MKLRLFASALVVVAGFGVASAQQPAGVGPVLQGMASQPATHTAFTFDKNMLQTASGFFDDGSGAVSALNSVTVENYRYAQPAFYVPENMHALVETYNAAGWKHLVEGNVSPGQSASPTKPLTDLWLHFHGMEIDDVTVLVRGVKQMSVIEISGSLRPLDLVHLSGHFGIPKVDPSAVMVPAAPGR